MTSLTWCPDDVSFLMRQDSHYCPISDQNSTSESDIAQASVRPMYAHWDTTKKTLVSWRLKYCKNKSWGIAILQKKPVHDMNHARGVPPGENCIHDHTKKTRKRVYIFTLGQKGVCYPLFSKTRGPFSKFSWPGSVNRGYILSKTQVSSDRYHPCLVQEWGSHCLNKWWQLQHQWRGDDKLSHL